MCKFLLYTVKKQNIAFALVKNQNIDSYVFRILSSENNKLNKWLKPK